MTTASTAPRPAAAQRANVAIGATAVAATAALLLARPLLADTFSAGRPRAWMTVFVAIFLQAMPFLIFGVVLSGLIGPSPTRPRTTCSTRAAGW